MTNKIEEVNKRFENMMNEIVMKMKEYEKEEKEIVENGNEDDVETNVRKLNEMIERNEDILSYEEIFKGEMSDTFKRLREQREEMISIRNELHQKTQKREEEGTEMNELKKIFSERKVMKVDDTK